ncbi:hypothetical protein ACTA71_007212 [Dictyostelium dimigraforme]
MTKLLGSFLEYQKITWINCTVKFSKYLFNLIGWKQEIKLFLGISTTHYLVFKFKYLLSKVVPINYIIQLITFEPLIQPKVSLKYVLERPDSYNIIISLKRNRIKINHHNSFGNGIYTK